MIRLRPLFILMLIFSSISVRAEVIGLPDWLRGWPADIFIRSERCLVYRWIFARADEQTEGLASQQSLARKRVINMANRLVDHHQASRQEEYAARVKYLAFGETDSYHFDFRISAAKLDSLLAGPCEQG